MDTEFEYDLRPDQWEELKALRLPAVERRILQRRILDQLVALGLASISDDEPIITARGRQVLLRGSPRLLDVAA